MRVKLTADYPEEEIRSLLHFAARSVGVKHSGWTVWVKNCKHGVSRGTCYWWRKHITIGIGQPKFFPCSNWRSRQKTIYANWREAFIDIAAHEFAHAHQSQGHWVRHKETDANWQGWKALQEYRKEKHDRVHRHDQSPVLAIGLGR